MYVYNNAQVAMEIWAGITKKYAEISIKTQANSYRLAKVERNKKIILNSIIDRVVWGF